MKLLAAFLLGAVLVLLLRRPCPPDPRIPRHLDPAICHAGWCPTARTGRPDDCDCTAAWVAA